jgi:predicted nuclease of predicted toxin-antitoxin system
VSQSLLLDEMFSDDVAQQLRAKGYDVISVVADSALTGLPDDQVLAYAGAEGRALVTANIKDFVPLDGRYRAAGQPHSGLILVSTKTFTQNCGFPSAITTALATLLSGTAKIQPGQVLFLTREGLGSPLQLGVTTSVPGLLGDPGHVRLVQARTVVQARTAWSPGLQIRRPAWLEPALRAPIVTARHRA